MRGKGNVGNGEDDRGPCERYQAIERCRKDNLSKTLYRPLHLRRPGRPFIPSPRGRGDEKIPRDHKEDFVGPAAQQANKTEDAGIGEGGKWCVFYDPGADCLEGPLKGVENRDSGDRDEAQRFDRYIACGFGLHVFLSSLSAP